MTEAKISLPDTLDVDDAPYPSEERLEQIRKADSLWSGARWLVDVFPKLAEELAPYGRCQTSIDRGDFDDRPEYVIEFTTSGWSGCEDFINAVLGNLMLNVMYYAKWERGGHHEFRVSKAQYDASAYP